MLPRMAQQPDGGRSQGAVRVGTDLDDPTLLKSGWYPKGANDAESRLRFYATQFPIVEVDACALPPPREQAGLWVDRTPPDFVFNIKAFNRPAARPSRGPAGRRWQHRDKERFYASHLSADGQAGSGAVSATPCSLLDSAGKLGAVLLQYPEWFTPVAPAARSSRPSATVSAATRSASSSAAPPGWPPTATATAPSGSYATATFPWSASTCPRASRSSVPPSPTPSPALSVVRFHGRDPEAWKKKTVSERFRYLYTEKELAEWVPKIGHLATPAEVHILMNNCFRDQAVTNAGQLADLLNRADVPVVAPGAHP